MLEGKNALVTGSTSGIGLAIAQAFAARGVNVMLNGFGEAAQIESLRQRIADKHGVRAEYHGADLRDAAQVADLMAQAEARIGGVDILVNNAGIQFVAAVEEFPPQAWRDIIDINLVALFHTIRHAVPGMKRRGWGRIINIASAHALVASPFKSAYVAAKHGVAGLTKAVALETAASGITCNAICPGYVLTPLVEKQIPDTARARGISEEAVVRDVLLAAQPTKQFVTVEQVAALACFLADDGAASITGSLQAIDGGWTAQ